MKYLIKRWINQQQLATSTNLRNSRICSLEASFNALRGFVGVFDRRLQKIDWELRVNFSCDPGPVLLVDALVCLKLNVKSLAKSAVPIFCSIATNRFFCSLAPFRVDCCNQLYFSCLEEICSTQKKCRMKACAVRIITEATKKL